MPKGCSHVVIIENEWLWRMKNTVLYVYEFDDTDFYLQDECAGYYVSEKPQIPSAVHIITDLETELQKRSIELRTVDNLWDISDEIKRTTFNWSICRMVFAKERK